jgi:hypothetical protein
MPTKEDEKNKAKKDSAIGKTPGKGADEEKKEAVHLQDSTRP